MGNKRIEMFEIRNVLVRMRLGDSDRDLSRSGLIVPISEGWIWVPKDALNEHMH